MDFNTQRKIVKSLETKGKNPLLFIPCTIAKYAVILFMSACRSVDMALSDREGNFLGIKHRERKKKSFDREMARLESRLEKENAPKTEKPQRVIHRSFGLRAVSFVMAFAFAFMILPELPAAAAEVSGIVSGRTVTVPTASAIDSTLMNVDLGAVSELDLYSNYNANSSVNIDIASGTFTDMPLLTSVVMGVTDQMVIRANNFSSTAPDAMIFVRASSKAEFDQACAALGNADSMAVWDKDGTAYLEIPDNVQTVKAYGGDGKIILSWTPVSGADGYRIYSCTDGRYSLVNSFTASQAASTAANSLGCTAEMNVSNGSKAVYAVRAYKNLAVDYDNDGIYDESGIVFSKLFSNAPEVQAAAVGNPVIAAQTSNTKITVSVALPSGTATPSYVVIYSREEMGYTPVGMIDASALASGSAVFTDPTAYGGKTRSYAAAAYYDPLGRNNGLTLSQHTYPSGDITDGEYAVRRSNVIDITGAKLNTPNNFRYNLVKNNGTASWELRWDAPDNSDEYSGNIVYILTANYKEFARTTSLSYPVSMDSDYVERGKNVVFGISAAVNNNTALQKSDEVALTIDVENNCVKLGDITLDDGFADITVKNPSAGDKFTVHYSYTDVYGKEYPDSKTFTAAECTASGNDIVYHLTGLVNGREYTFYVSSELRDYPSEEKTGTASNAPDAPSKVTASVKSNGVRLDWTNVKTDSGDDVPGYYVTIKKTGGKVVLGPVKVEGENYFESYNLENDVKYIAYVSAYVVNSDNTVTQGKETASNEFMPELNVTTQIHVTAVPNNSKQQIDISWLSVDGADKYYLYRTDSSGDTITWDMSKKTKYTDKDVSNNVEYSYTVQVYRKDASGNSVPSETSEPAKAKLNVKLSPVGGVTVQGIDKGIVLKWEKVDDADGYYIECMSSSEASWKRVGQTEKTTFTHSGLTDNAEYRYRIIPYIIVNGEEVFDYSDVQVITGIAGVHLNSPTDFTVTCSGTDVTLKWTAVSGAEGYEIYVVSSNGSRYLLDRVSKTTALHQNVPDGTSITYMVCAYKYVDGEIVSGDPSVLKSILVGDVTLDAPADVTATGGYRSVQVKWSAVNGADGYVVYCYDTLGLSYKAVGIVTGTKFEHTGLYPNTTYTYMVAAYKNVDSNPHFSKYSIVAMATTNYEDGTAASNGDYRIYITGTTPYGMSNSKYISASAERGAFNSDVDVRFTLSSDTLTSVQNVLQFYGKGVDSFLIYPMDISLYQSGTDIHAAVNPGYYLNLTIPVPDMLLPYSDYISVVHVSDDAQLEILPSTHLDISGVDSIQFYANTFSPYAFVIYLPDIAEDTSSGAVSSAQGTVEYDVSSQETLMCTTLPEFIRSRRKFKRYHIVNK